MDLMRITEDTILQLYHSSNPPRKPMGYIRMSEAFKAVASFICIEVGKKKKMSYRWHGTDEIHRNLISFVPEEILTFSRPDIELAEKEDFTYATAFRMIQGTQLHEWLLPQLGLEIDKTGAKAIIEEEVRDEKQRMLGHIDLQILPDPNGKDLYIYDLKSTAKAINSDKSYPRCISAEDWPMLNEEGDVAYNPLAAYLFQLWGYCRAKTAQGFSVKKLGIIWISKTYERNHADEIIHVHELDLEDVTEETAALLARYDEAYDQLIDYVNQLMAPSLEETA